MALRTRLLPVLLLALVGFPCCAPSKASPAELEQLLGVLRLEQGVQVADVGAGDGEWSEALAREVGPTGHVFTTEVDEDDLSGIRERLEEAGLENFTAILGDDIDTGLPENCCDVILLRLVYHHFTDPPSMRESLRAAMKEDARLVAVEIRPQAFWERLPDVPERDGHGISVEDLIEEMTSDGFEVVNTYDEWEGDDDHFCVVFRSTHGRAVRQRNLPAIAPSASVSAPRR